MLRLIPASRPILRWQFRSTIGAGEACPSIFVPASTCRKRNRDRGLLQAGAVRRVPVHSRRPNWLVISIAPDQGISLQFDVKHPGPALDLAAVKINFRYDDWFPKEPSVGYATLLYDVMIGDPTLFMRADMVEQTWRIVQPVLDARVKHDAADLPIYPAGSSGPGEADALLARDGRRWRSLNGDDGGRPS
jgi:glucose-6-phosphate 1-dehydrogenase